MIRFVNVNKEYRSKKGQVTKALNDININLGNKGLVFIIGKSGSGKSTLLNILGGLDSKTSGKIYIDNKDLDSFREKDYDSYRNTYIGFIFQDFNLLEEYNVFDNVMLSAKLLRKKVDKEEILNLLERLGLKGLEYRNINELSGGQKQRVGIARALIKNPKVILADEPTGNLDSHSSLETFKLLKEISKEKLVVVVSHDLENANTYADKILELQDGNAIRNDLTVEAKDDNTFSLTKSRLPFKECLHFALTSLKSNKVKLFFTVILTMISLVFMGISVNTSMFDKNILATDTLIENNETYYDISYVNIINPRLNDIEELPMTDEIISDYEKENNVIANPIYSIFDNNSVLSFEEVSDDAKDTINPIVNYIEVKDDRLLSNIIGTIPKANNEIVIHKYLANNIMEKGIKDINGDLFKPTSYDNLVNSRRELLLGLNNVIIVGIVDDDNSRYKDLSNETIQQDYANYYVNKAYTIYGKNLDLKFNTTDEAILNHAIINEDKVLKDGGISGIKVYNNNGDVITQVTNLKSDEVIVSLNYLQEYVNGFKEELDIYLANNSGDYNSLLSTFVSNYITINNLTVPFETHYNTKGYYKDLKIKGVSLTNNYISKDYMEELKNEVVHKELVSFRIYDNNETSLLKVFRKYPSYEEDASGKTLFITMPYSDDINSLAYIYNILNKYINIVTLVFILFTILLFSNFIYVSINYSKKQIGILRALGTNKGDIIRIFLYESLTVSIISYITSIILWFIIISILNNSIFGNRGFIFNGIVTHPLVPILMFIYTIIISIIITIISLSKITKIKPIDAILNK